MQTFIAGYCEISLIKSASERRNHFEPETDGYYNRKANTSSANTIGNDTGRTGWEIECYPAGAIELGAWSIFASVNSYVNHQQILTFYTVELLAVLFVRLHPVFTTSLIVSSYAVNYIILNFGFIKGLINPYNYIMLMVLSAVGAILNYHLTANYISEKNKANLLNESLEIIANHDSTTRLQNRYALNQRIPDFLDKDICVTMGDINKFKEVNDTYGHRTGDDVLKTFADILLQFFPRESVFRYGGDEFLIIENGSDVDTMREKLRKVNEKFAGVRIANMQTGLSFCFGCISAHPQNPTELFSVLTKADQILYDEKEKTKSTFES